MPEEKKRDEDDLEKYLDSLGHWKGGEGESHEEVISLLNQLLRRQDENKMQLTRIEARLEILAKKTDGCTSILKHIARAICKIFK
jgi:hypothetical protein